MDNIIMLILCLNIGIIFRYFDIVPADAHVAFNKFIIFISLPSVTLLQIHLVKLNSSLPMAALMPWIIFTVSAVLFGIIGYRFKLESTTIGALIIAGGLGNTSFIGLPMIEAFYGKVGEPVGIVIDQVGTYLALSTIGILVICIYTEGTFKLKSTVKRIVTFPPLIALALALALRGVTYPTWSVNMLSHLGSSLAPLALVSIGLQLRWGAFMSHRWALAAGLGFKLFIAPALVATLYIGKLALHGFDTNITLFEAGMAPQIGAAIVATQLGLNKDLLTLMVGFGTVLSFVTLPIWWYFFH